MVKLFVTDFDGTLCRGDGSLGSADIDALQELGRRGIVRALATGRSLYSLQRAASDLPVDYVIFSMGTGIYHYQKRQVIKAAALTSAQVARSAQVLMAARLDFMIHQPCPHNHCFEYWQSPTPSADFRHRLAIYRNYCRPLQTQPTQWKAAAQLLAIAPTADCLPAVQAQLPDLSIVRTTSPLDGHSVWIEIFAPGICKSSSTAWLARHLEIERWQVAMVGNDYNDLDLLEWAGRAFVVANAPEELRVRFQCVASNDSNGVAQAVGHCLADLTAHQKP